MKLLDFKKTIGRGKRICPVSGVFSLHASSHKLQANFDTTRPAYVIHSNDGPKTNKLKRSPPSTAAVDGANINTISSCNNNNSPNYSSSSISIAIIISIYNSNNILSINSSNNS